MSIETTSMGALFATLIIILAVNPRSINNIYNSILGRVFLIGIVIFFSMNNLTLGLLVALAIITASNQFGSFTEGMENGTTIGEDNTNSTGTTKVLTDGAIKQAAKSIELTSEQKNEVSKKISDLKAKATAAGIDVEAIKSAIMSKESKSIPVDPNVMKSDDVSPSTSGMLVSSSLEGFKAYASF